MFFSLLPLCIAPSDFAATHRQLKQLLLADAALWRVLQQPCPVSDVPSESVDEASAAHALWQSVHEVMTIWIEATALPVSPQSPPQQSSPQSSSLQPPTEETPQAFPFSIRLENAAPYSADPLAVQVTCEEAPAADETIQRLPAAFSLQQLLANTPSAMLSSVFCSLFLHKHVLAFSANAHKLAALYALLRAMAGVIGDIVAFRRSFDRSSWGSPSSPTASSAATRSSPWRSISRGRSGPSSPA